MVQRTFTIKGRLGLHARASARLVRVATSFQSRMSLERMDGSATADAKSILSVLMLAASQGTELRAIADGEDEDEAIKALNDLFCDGFGESDLAES